MKRENHTIKDPPKKYILKSRGRTNATSLTCTKTRIGNLKERQTLLLKSPVMRSPFRNTMYFSFLSLSLFVHAMVREQVWLIPRIYDKVGYAAVAQSLYHRNDTVRVRVALNGYPTQKAYLY